MAWEQYGLHAYVPAPYHYAVVLTVCSIPFILVCSLLCFMSDEDESYDAPPVKVAPNKSKSSRPEKLD